MSNKQIVAKVGNHFCQVCPFDKQEDKNLSKNQTLEIWGPNFRIFPPQIGGAAGANLRFPVC